MTDEKKIPDEELEDVTGAAKSEDWAPGDGQGIVSPYAKNPKKAPVNRPKPDWAE
jgi:hypothetical protein